MRPGRRRVTIVRVTSGLSHMYLTWISAACMPSMHAWISASPLMRHISHYRRSTGCAARHPSAPLGQGIRWMRARHCTLLITPGARMLQRSCGALRQAHATNHLVTCQHYAWLGAAGILWVTSELSLHPLDLSTCQLPAQQRPCVASPRWTQCGLSSSCLITPRSAAFAALNRWPARSLCVSRLRVPTTALTRVRPHEREIMPSLEAFSTWGIATVAPKRLSASCWLAWGGETRSCALFRIASWTSAHLHVSQPFTRTHCR